MSHMRRAENFQDEETDEDDLESGNPRRIITTDKYIENVIGTPASDSDSGEVELVSIKERAKGKRKSSERVAFSEDEEEDDAYEKFKNRKSIKRKRINATNKRAQEKRNTIVGRKNIRSNGESRQQAPRIWGDVSDYEDEDSLPDYLKKRRTEFEKNRERLELAGLRLPPTYEDIEFSDDDQLEFLEERPSFPETVKVSRTYEDIPLELSGGFIPAPIAQYLRDYQVEGVAFLHELFVYQKGGILGDDMGLGKTVQVAAFLTAAFGKTGDERDGKRMRKMRRAPGNRWYPRVLVICPGSLIENWKAELRRWGWWHVDAYHGTNKDDVLQAVANGRLEIVITTYVTYKNNRSQLNLVQWDVVIADECHQLKERTSQTTQAMNEVNALCRIGLTGTAIQNKYEELWTLLNWTNPGRFGPISTWRKSISEPLRMGQSHDATLHQLARARTTAIKLSQNLLPQFFRRRMKSLIAHQLPKKSDKVVFCPLTALQQDAYQRFLDSELVEIIRNSSDVCECFSGKKRGWCCHATLRSGDKWQVLVFPVISQLQKLSNHLALLIPQSGDVQEKQERDLEFLQEMVPDQWQELYQNRDSILNLANPEFCGKWKILKKLLKFWHGNGDKVLVFSHSVRLLRMLQHLFNNTSYNVSFLDGSMTYEDRQKTVDDFNTDAGQFVFLISTKAGGVGLNITSANKVVIMDPNWNPSYDLQAQDRAYRIGQVRDVEVFRLISAGTIEEIVYARQIYKQQQANIGYNASMERRYFKGVQNSKEHKGEIFGLQNLLTFHGDDVVLREIVNNTNVAESRANVNILDVDMDALDDDDNPLKVDDESEDAAMSQLAALLVEDGENPKALKKQKMKGKGAKRDAVQAILASAGVEYTHENSEVVGSSKVEALLSRRAQEAGNDIDLGDEVMFANESQYREMGDEGRIRYCYRPPEEVLKRQFCTMAKHFGFESATEFALVVEGWTQEERRGCLDRFYRARREKLEEIEKEKMEEERKDKYTPVYTNEQVVLVESEEDDEL